MGGPLPVILLALATLVVGVIGIGVLAEASAQRRDVVRRAAGVDPFGPGRGLRGRLDARIRRTAWGHRLLERLRSAGLDTGVLDSLLLLVSVCVLAVLLTASLFGYVGSGLLVLMIVFGADRWLERRIQQRVEAFVGQLPEVARVLSNAASAGLALRTSIDMAASELPDPAGEEFRTVAEAMAIGQSLDQALESVHKRLPSRELAVLIQTLVIQSRAGGALVSALQNIALTLEQRKELRREVKTVVSGAVFGGYVVTALGIGAVFIMNVLSPGALDALSGTGLGRIVLLVAAFFFAAGYFLINRLTRIEV